MVCMKLYDFEGQKGVLRLLMYLRSTGKEVSAGAVMQETDIYFRVLMKSLRILEDMGLAESGVDSTTYPPKRMISLTGLGKEVADRLMEIERLLEGHG